MNLPKIGNYGQYSSGNYGAHSLVVEVGPVTVWFSYRTPIAFQVDGHSQVVHRNDWSTTTGKHLNWIDNGNKKGRVDAETFEKLWTEQVVPALAGSDNPADIFTASMN
jgi:hypothetical protein